MFADKSPVYTNRWRPPHYIRERTEAQNDAVREAHHIIAEGDNIPPPIARFEVSRAKLVKATVDTDTMFPAGYETACTDPEIP
jgi:hypothetical protein